MKFDNKNITDKLNVQLDKITGREKADPERVHNRSLRSGRFSFSGRFVALALAVVIVLVAAVSVLVIVREKGGDDEESSAPSEETTASFAAGDPLRTEILLCLTKSESEGVEFLANMKIDTENGSVSIEKIDQRKLASLGSKTSTIEGHFNSGGISALQKAAFAGAGVNSSRYVVCTEEGLTYFFSLLDPVELTIENDTRFDFNGINLTFEKGTKEFSADELVKYFCFLSENTEGNEPKLEFIFKSIAESFFDEENEERFVELFTSAVNYFSTDISAVDIQNYKQVINDFAKNGGIDSLSFKIIPPVEISVEEQN